MSSKDAIFYLNLVTRDEQALKLLVGAARSKRDVSDWVVTLHFYVLCIYVKATGRCFGQDFQDHYAIRNWINSEARLLPIAADYRTVEEW